MGIRARLLSGARWSLVLVAIGVILLIGFLPTYAQGDEEGTVSTPASQSPYLPLQAQAVNVNITQINPSKFPIVELYALVTDQDGNTIPGLSASNFRATEQSNLESQPTTETISVASVTTTGNIAVALAIDRSSSMSGSEIEDAKTAANIFVDNMATLDRAAIISFSSSVTVNQTFTSDKSLLHDAVNSLSAGGMTALYDAIYEAIEEVTGEFGVKVVIVLTDGINTAGSSSPQEAINLAKNKGVPVYTIGLGSSVNESILQTIANETGGYYTFAPTAADLQQIYDDIAQAIRDQYLVTYRTHNPNYDGTTRTVEVTVTVGANSDSDTATYTVTEPPEINLTQDTLNLIAQAQYAAQTLTIGAIITDDVAVTQAKLFYRTSGSGDIYKEVSMTSSSDLYTADIPGSDVAAPGVDFYITASDGTLTSSSPQNNPATYPHQISILPNEAPVIGHTPVTTATAGASVVISANVTDTTDYVDSVKLFYRTTGYVLYDSTDMVSSSATYVATIPGSKVTEAGVDYYIVASDNHSVRTYDGTDVVPHHINVTSGPINHPPTAKIETHVIDSANGTAKFTWSGSDDSTPPAQLVYKHRLLNPDSPLYDWSDWSSSTTATYPRPPDSRLPDGTYRFQVKAKDADEAIQPDSATWEFTIRAAPSEFWVQVYNTGSTLAIRKTPGTKNKPADDVLKRVPDGWVLKVLSTVDENGNTVVKDGFTWWKVEESEYESQPNTGWVAKKYLKEVSFVST
ncbi:MAG: VWA domain-containing protein, partial [Dehalococcoidia bacterium]|nr:VWA domain-containing protein [Dehalococcoidia bacterium]